MKSECLCALSGGMDSSTAAYMIKQDMPVHTIFFRYGQRTETRESECFQMISDELCAVSRHIVDLSFYKSLNTSALVNPVAVIPTEDTPDVIPPTYVPFRNGVILSVAASFAQALGIANISIGAVWEDSSGYPDCREEFLVAMNRAINLGIPPGENITVLAPVLHLGKAEIIKTGMALGLDYRHTYSCYKNNDRPCLECPSCRLRMRAFESLGLTDPLLSEK